MSVLCVAARGGGNVKRSFRFRPLLFVVAVAAAALWASPAMAMTQPALAAGYAHSVGLRSDGSVVATGWNIYGQCNVSTWTNIKAVSGGQDLTVGLKSDGTVVVIGNNGSDSQFGPFGWTDIKAVSAGWYYIIGLKSDGSVVATGSTYYGKCNVSGWTGIKAVSAGYGHTVGLKSDGTVVATGDNHSGQCNVSGWTDITAVSAAEDHTVGLKSDGTVVAIGYNAQGQCNVSGWTDIVAVATGDQHSLGLKSDGTVVATGYNGWGQSNVSGWNLLPEDLSTALISGISESYVYTGSAISPVPIVTLGGRTLAAGVDYTLSYSKNTAAGTASVTVTGKHNYSGIAARTFTIEPASVAFATVSGVNASYAYTGSAIAPVPVVALGGRTLASGIDYTLSYFDNSLAGTATVQVTGIGNYTGVIARTFGIGLGWNSSREVLLVGRKITLVVTGASGLVTWSSTNNTVATVSSTGLVTAVRAGKATVRATVNGVTVTCEVTVIKYNYRVSLSRSVSSGNGYINVTAKTWDGHALKYRKVKVYRSGSYLGTVKTNAYGKARLRVSKIRSYRTYKAVIVGDTRYNTTSSSRVLAFTTTVFSESDTDILFSSTYLRAGTYRVYVWGYGYLSGRVGTFTATGGDGSWKEFRVIRGRYYSITGIAFDFGGTIEVTIERYL